MSRFPFAFNIIFFKRRPYFSFVLDNSSDLCYVFNSCFVQNEYPYFGWGKVLMDTNYLIVYGLMILFVGASFVISSRQHQRLRQICDPFGLAFTEAAVHAIGQTAPDYRLKCGEHGLPLPINQQPAAVQQVLARGADDYCKERHETMLRVLTHLRDACGSNKRHTKVYADTLEEIYRVNRVFFEACRDLSLLSTEDDCTAFSQYLENQAYIRDNIAKRMTNDGIAAMKKAAL